MSKGWRDEGSGPWFSFSFLEEALELFTSIKVILNTVHQAIWVLPHTANSSFLMVFSNNSIYSIILFSANKFYSQFRNVHYKAKNLILIQKA